MVRHDFRAIKVKCKSKEIKIQNSKWMTKQRGKVAYIPAQQVPCLYDKIASPNRQLQQDLHFLGLYWTNHDWMSSLNTQQAISTTKKVTWLFIQINFDMFYLCWRPVSARVAVLATSNRSSVPLCVAYLHVILQFKCELHKTAGGGRGR